MLKALLGLVAGLIIGVMAAIGTVLFLIPGPTFSGVALAQAYAPSDLTISLSESYLESKIAASLASHEPGLPLQDVNVDVRPGSTIVVSAGTNIPFGQVRGSAVLALSPSDGGISARLVEARVGGLPVQRLIGNQLEKMVNDQLATLNKDFPFEVVSVTTTESDLVIGANMMQG